MPGVPVQTSRHFAKETQHKGSSCLPSANDKSEAQHAVLLPARRGNRRRRAAQRAVHHDRRHPAGPELRVQRLADVHAAHRLTRARVPRAHRAPRAGHRLRPHARLAARRPPPRHAAHGRAHHVSHLLAAARARQFQQRAAALPRARLPHALHRQGLRPADLLQQRDGPCAHLRRAVQLERAHGVLRQCQPVARGGAVGRRLTRAAGRRARGGHDRCEGGGAGGVAPLGYFR